MIPLSLGLEASGAQMSEATSWVSPESGVLSEWKGMESVNSTVAQWSCGLLEIKVF